jgi:predicted RNA-binding Zn ribbon-like protein
MNKKSDPFVDRGFGDSASWLDFVNSELLDGFGNLTDMLDDPAWLNSFLRYWRFRIPINAAPLKELRLLRAQIRKILESAALKGKLHIEQVQPLNEWLKIAVYPRLMEDQNGLHLSMVPAQSGWPVILANITSSFAEALIQQQNNRLKICENPGCGWIFVDGTRGNVRRWCSSKTCGNRERVRRARILNKK